MINIAISSKADHQGTKKFLNYYSFRKTRSDKPGDGCSLLRAFTLYSSILQWMQTKPNTSIYLTHRWIQKMLSGGWGPDFFSHQLISQRAVQTSIDKQLDPRGPIVSQG